MLLLHKDQYKKRTRNAPTCTIPRETKARIPRKHVEFDRTSIGTSLEESVASSSFTLFCSIKTFCWTHGTGWEEMEAIGFLMLLGTSFWTMERATSPSSCSVACVLVTHSRLPTVYPTKQLSLKSMNWTGCTIAPPLPAFQTSPHRPPAMHEAQQNLGTLDKPHNITFLTVAWLYPLLAVSSTMVYSSLCYSTPLHPTLLFSALLYSSL